MSLAGKVICSVSRLTHLHCFKTSKSDCWEITVAVKGNQLHTLGDKSSGLKGALEEAEIAAHTVTDQAVAQPAPTPQPAPAVAPVAQPQQLETLTTPVVQPAVPTTPAPQPVAEEVLEEVELKEAQIETLDI